MIFPRKTMKVGECLALLYPKGDKYGKIGDPLIRWYTTTKYNGDQWLSHRLSYHLNCSDIPRKPENYKEGLVLHSCDNKWCVNPNHLSIGNSSKNIKEAYQRGETKDERKKKLSSWGKKMRAESLPIENSLRAKKAWKTKKEKYGKQGTVTKTTEEEYKRRSLKAWETRRQKCA